MLHTWLFAKPKQKQTNKKPLLESLEIQIFVVSSEVIREKEKWTYLLSIWIISYWF